MSYHSKTRFCIIAKELRRYTYHLMRPRRGHGSNDFNAFPRPASRRLVRLRALTFSGSIIRRGHPPPSCSPSRRRTPASRCAAARLDPPDQPGRQSRQKQEASHAGREQADERANAQAEADARGILSRDKARAGFDSGKTATPGFFEPEARRATNAGRRQEQEAGTAETRWSQTTRFRNAPTTFGADAPLAGGGEIGARGREAIAPGSMAGNNPYPAIFNPCISLASGAESARAFRRRLFTRDKSRAGGAIGNRAGNDLHARTIPGILRAGKAEVPAAAARLIRAAPGCLCAGGFCVRAGFGSRTATADSRPCPG